MFIRKIIFLAVVFLFIPRVVLAETTSTTSTVSKVFKVFSADCSQINEGLLANACYEKKALSNLNCAYCEKINWFGGRVSCCMKVINDNSPLDACDNLTDLKLKEKCLSHLAAKTNTPSLCGKIKDKNENFACRAELAKQVRNLKDCDKLSKAEKDYCLLKFAETDKNEKLCAKIAVKGVKQACYNKLAVLKNNEKLCPLTADKDKCYLALAEKKRDGKLCSKIKDGLLVGYCLDRVAVAKKDVNVCNLIKGNYKFDCIFDVAVAKDSASICEKITDKEKNYQCVKGFAVRRELINYCDYLKDKTRVGLCADEVEKKINARVQDMQRMADLKNIQEALELYFKDYGEYPRGEKLLLGRATTICLTSAGINGDNWNCESNPTTTYLAKIPADPINTGIYVYEYTRTTGLTPCYQIVARLETDYENYKAGPILASCDGKILQ